jgi:hypothetical protein
VQEALGRFRTRAERHVNGYLVKTREDEVFFLGDVRCHLGKSAFACYGLRQTQLHGSDP